VIIVRIMKGAVFATVVGLSSASAVVERNALENGMQPDVVAKTLSAVQGEWKAQIAIFADCDISSDSASPVVNCKHAKSSFEKSCSTISNAIVQGSGGDKDVMKEYMGDVCKQNAMTGWHKVQCDAVSSLIGKSMSADKYQNRMSFNSAKLCNGLWSNLLTERQQEAAKEKAEKEAAQKKADEEAAVEEKQRQEAEKKRQERKKAEQAEREKQEVAVKAAEAKAKAAEAAAEAAEKKAQAKAVAKAEAEKLAAEKAAAEKAAAVKAAAEKAKKEADAKAEAEKAAAAKKAQEVVAKNTAKFLVSAAAPAPAAAGKKSAGGKPENLNDKMPLKAAEQGFTGKKVSHTDGKTSAADWQNEYSTKGASFLVSAAAPAPAKDAKAKGGKPENLNDKMPLKAAEQGFSGKKVKHEDGKTASSDWHKEYANSK